MGSFIVLLKIFLWLRLNIVKASLGSQKICNSNIKILEWVKRIEVKTGLMQTKHNPFVIQNTSSILLVEFFLSILTKKTNTTGNV